MRSESESPLKNNFMCEYLNKMWKNGWLNSFSNKHFLIRAMENRIGDFVGEAQLLENNFEIYSFNNNLSINFSINLSSKLEYLSRVFDEQSISRFIKDQLSAGKSNYNEDQFFRALSEVEVLKYFSTFGYSVNKKAVYEPAIGRNGKNPEARFFYDDDVIVDVEVKTPGFSNTIINEKLLIPTVLLEDQGRLLNTYANKNNVKCICPRIHKLVTFINSANEKFESPHSSKHLNLLYINWSYSEFPSKSYLEAYSLLHNDLNGLINHKKIGFQFGIEETAYEKISAIVVYTSSMNNLIFQDLRYLWATRNFAIIPMNVDEKLLLQVTGMDYKMNCTTPYILADFKSRNIEEMAREVRICGKANELVKQTYFKEKF